MLSISSTVQVYRREPCASFPDAEGYLCASEECFKNEVCYKAVVISDPMLYVLANHCL